MKRYLGPQDAAFLRMESARTPMHVGALLIFRRPADAAPDHLRTLLQRLREQPFMPPPFDCRISRSAAARLLPAWEPVEADMEHHVRHLALPRPGGERELGRLIERMHSHPLDFSRPLWEAHLIEGLEHDRFALYLKAHHCAIDGIGAMKLVREWLSEDPDDLRGPRVPERRRRTGDDAAPADGLLRRALATTRGGARTATELLKTFYALGQGGEDSVLRAAATTPRSLFNVPIRQQRRLGTQLLELARFKAVGATVGATVNDVALAVCAGAVRRYLLKREALPGPSLTASIPMALPRTDGKPGNAVSGFVCPLATDEADPRRRLERIAAITARTKQQMTGRSPAALEQFALLGMAPLLLGQMAGVLSRVPPFFNFVVSNIIASTRPLYLMGAQMEAMYPVSFLLDGYALNVTVIGYADKVAIGFLGCRDAIPHLQRLAVYAGEALTELEAAVARPAPSPPRRGRKRSARPRATSAAGRRG